MSSRAVVAGAAAMTFVGGSAAVAALLGEAPLFGTQAVRYTLACLLLVGFARLAGQRLRRPRGTEWLWLSGVTVTGLVLFNVALVRGAEHAEPAVLGVAVACVPVVLALVAPLMAGQRPSRTVLVAAGVVSLGAALVTGGGRSDAVGLAWALLVLVCEAGFTLLAVPVLRRHGPWGVSVHSTWLAALVFAVLAVPADGPAALRLDVTEWLAMVYLAVLVTAVAFVLWYGSVHRLGAARAGLLTGVAPVAAAAVGVALGAPVPSLLVWLGIAVVAAGLTLGLRGMAADGPPGSQGSVREPRCRSGRPPSGAWQSPRS